MGINLKCVKDEFKKTQGHHWKVVNKHTKVFDCGFIDIFPSKLTKKYRLILVKGQKRIERRIPKNQRKQGKGSRSSCVTYQEIVFGILTNIEGHPILIHEFYKQRQTIENYFRDSNWSFQIGKLPSQQFRANQAYLWLMSITQNALLWFKHQCLPDDWQSCSDLQIRDELINHKALDPSYPFYVQINFSIYFKYEEVHDFAANRLEIINNNLENGLPLDNVWKFAEKLSLAFVLEKKKLKPLS